MTDAVILLLLVLVAARQQINGMRERAFRNDVRSQLRTMHDQIERSLNDRFDAREFLKQRLAERATEFHQGGGRERLRARLAARQQEAK
jgi:sensor domain CHASE-containing protein